MKNTRKKQGFEREPSFGCLSKDEYYLDIAESICKRFSCIDAVSKSHDRCRRVLVNAEIGKVIAGKVDGIIKKRDRGQVPYL